MDQHSIKNLKNPIDRLDAVNKTYANHIKYKTASGNIPNTVLTDHILFTFPTGKAFASGKIKICEMWVERLVLLLLLLFLLIYFYFFIRAIQHKACRLRN